MPVTVYCAYCGKPKKVWPSRVTRYSSGLLFCNQEHWLLYRAEHPRTSTIHYNRQSITDYIPQMQRFLETEGPFVKTRDITKGFLDSNPDFMKSNASSHGQKMRVGMLLAKVCGEPYSKPGRGVLYRNPYCVKHSVKIEA